VNALKTNLDITFKDVTSIEGEQIQIQVENGINVKHNGDNIN
jgi:hypothetical protein